ncbi:LOW QUALITY PROTEIN: hypothetical protein Sjap_009894 [Stephania japonica]|uniref:Plant heme peroxidase family profile domain-containing protein n=1 Tax=Stephania japonica TaxID=461633 RepID=A0AAP0JAM7_9MAGN
MDPSSTTFDNTYYKLLLQGKSLFSSDQALLTNPKTQQLVSKFASSQKAFYDAFVKSMIKMSSLNGGQEVRLDCKVVRGHLEMGDEVVGEKSLDGQTEEAIQKRDFGVNRFNVPTCQRHDVVKSKDNGMIGIVIEVGGDLDSESDTTDVDEEEEDEGEEEEGDNGSGSENEGKGDDDDDKNDPLPTGHVRVFWMNQSETTQNLDEVTVIDRAFLHGDIVSACSDPMGQVGVVTNVEISVDLLDQDGSMIKDVSARDLKRVRDFTVGDYVVLGPWLGRVDDVLDNVTVLFDDGAMCKVMKVDPLRLTSLSKGILEDGDYPYYPGQRVRASSSAVFKNARWLSGSWKASRLEGTITKVMVGSVFIYWIASAGCGSESLTAPAEEQGPNNLKLLSCLTHANWQVGDWCFLPSLVPSSYVSKDRNSLFITSKVASSVEFVSGAMEGEHISESLPDEKVDGNSPLFASVESMVLDKVDIDNLDINGEKEKNHASPESSPCSSSLSISKEPLPENWPFRRKKMRKVVIKRDKKARKKEENFDRSLLIVNSKTKVDVAWQDGRQELGLASINLIPIDNPGDQEFLPEQYVIEKGSDDNDDDNDHEVRHVGVVKSVNAKERTACVRWLKSVSRPEDPREFDKEEIVSVYELEVHPDYDYCYGDVVVRLSAVSVSSNVVGTVNPLEKSGLCGDHNNAEKDLMTEEDASSSGVLVGFSDLSWVGNITGLQDGDIEVTWANEMVSTVGPQAIYVVGRDDDEPSEYGSEVSDGAASWETVDEDGMNTLENAEEEVVPQDGSRVIPEAETTVDLEDCNSGGKGALAIPLAALGFVTRLATGFFSLGRKQNDSLGSVLKYVPQSLGIVDLLEQISSNVDSSSLSTNIITAHATQVGNDNFEEQGPISEVAKVEEPLYNLRSEELGVPSNLGCINLEVCSFKRFDTAKDPLDHFFLGANGQSSNGRKWLKKVHQDWGILQKNLPGMLRYKSKNMQRTMKISI